MQMKINKAFFLVLVLMCCGCTVGPKYAKPIITRLPETFKEGGVDWKKSAPQDQCDRGKWWLIFGSINIL